MRVTTLILTVITLAWLYKTHQRLDAIEEKWNQSEAAFDDLNLEMQEYWDYEVPVERKLEVYLEKAENGYEL